MNEPDQINNWIRRIEDIGVAREKLRILLNDDVFESSSLSKHNLEWHSADAGMDARLDYARRRFCLIRDSLWEIMEVLTLE